MFPLSRRHSRYNCISNSHGYCWYIFKALPKYTLDLIMMRVSHGHGRPSLNRRWICLVLLPTLPCRDSSRRQTSHGGQFSLIDNQSWSVVHSVSTDSWEFSWLSSLSGDRFLIQSLTMPLPWEHYPPPLWLWGPHGPLEHDIYMVSNQIVSLGIKSIWLLTRSIWIVTKSHLIPTQINP